MPRGVCRLARGPTGDTSRALRYGDGAMLTPGDQASHDIEVFDAATVAADLERLADSHTGNERELRLAVSRRLRAALVEGRAAAEQLVGQGTKRADHDRRPQRRSYWTKSGSAPGIL